MPASIWQYPSTVAAANCQFFVRDLIALSPEPKVFFLRECFSLAQLVTRLPFGSDHDVLPGFGANPA